MIRPIPFCPSLLPWKKETPVQVAIAWLMAQPNLVAIPKSGRAQGQKENLAAAGLALTAEDLAAIAALPKDRRLVNPDFAPDWAA